MIFARLFMENRKKKQGSLDSFFCSKVKQPKLQLNEEPDKVKETGTPVEAEKPKQRRFQQLWKTKYVCGLSMMRLKMQCTGLCATLMVISSEGPGFSVTLLNTRFIG